MNQPPYPPQGYPPQPMQSTQPPGFAQQPLIPMQQAPQTIPMQQTTAGVWAPQPAPQQQPMGVPAIHMPDDALVQAAYVKAQEEQARIARARSGQGGGGDLHWFAPLGPNGEKKWGASVPINYEASYIAWLCPPWAPGLLPHVDDPSHFYRSAAKPEGTGITCAGQNCWVCAARNALFKTGSELDAKKAKDAGKLTKRALYQIILLEYYQSHFAPDGRMVPWLFRAPSGLHNDIVEKIRMKTAMRIMHPEHGRPIVIKKKKTGSQTFEIDWSMDDLDPRPLDQHFYPIFQNLYDLTKFVTLPTLTEQYQAIVDMNFPVPPQLPALVQQEQAQLAAQQGQQVGMVPPMQGMNQLQAQSQQMPPGLPAAVTHPTVGMPGQPQMAAQPAYSPAPNAPGPNPYGAAQPPVGAPGMPPPGQPQPGYPPQPQGAVPGQGVQVQPAMGAPPGQPLGMAWTTGPGHTGNTAPQPVGQQPVDPNLLHLQTQMRGGY